MTFLCSGDARRCVGLTLLPLTGALSWLLYHRGDAFDHLFASAHADASQVAPPAPPSSPDWAKVATTAAFDFGTSHPIQYLTIDLGSAVAIGLVLLFWKDLVIAM